MNASCVLSLCAALRLPETFRAYSAAAVGKMDFSHEPRRLVGSSGRSARSGTAEARTARPAEYADRAAAAAPGFRGRRRRRAPAQRVRLPGPRGLHVAAV